MSRIHTRFVIADLGVTPAAPVDRIEWLYVRAELARIVRIFTYALVAATAAACIVAGLWIVLRSAPRDRLTVVAVLVRYLVPILSVIWAIPYCRSFSWLSRSLGTDGRRLILRSGNGHEIASETFDLVRTDGEYLLIGRRLVPLHHLHRDAFDVDRLRADIIGRLPPMALVSRNELWWHALRAGNRGLILILVFIIVVCLEKARR